MTSKLDIVRLEFTAPLHISDIRADYANSERMIHSDTLYAAIFQTWANLGHEDWISRNPDFAVTSLFPYTSYQGSIRYFFRRPYLMPENEVEVRPQEIRKKAKKVQFIEYSIFQNLLFGSIELNPNDIYGSYLSPVEIDPDFISASVIPRIRWHRNEKENAEPFYMEKLFVKKGSGFWFGLMANENERRKIDIALKLLSETGIGTDRNVGNGTFTYSWDTMHLNLPDDSEYSTNLSLFCPSTRQELDIMLQAKAGYDFIRRGGWLGEPYNTYRKRSIHMFCEGSVFSKRISKAESFGIVVDLSPENTPIPVSYPVYRIGKAIFLPIKL